MAWRDLGDRPGDHGGLFFLFTKDDPGLARRKAAGIKPVPFAEQMKPLRNLQVWRFSLYYFFVFGAFVALALWLPRYLTGVYGLDIKTAGMIAACYSIPASLFRILWWVAVRQDTARDG
jgi:NNP family nitrate/nitrite transporter-like MFS transporter